MGDKGQAILTGTSVSHKTANMTVPYQFESLLSTNPVIDTYQASPQGMMLKVVVKVLAQSLCAQPGFQARFAEAIKAQLDLGIPNIIKIFDYGNTQDLFYIISEAHKKPPLQAQLEKEGALTPQVAVETTEVIAATLELTHKQGLTHGLLTPASILLSSSRGALITDFGLVKLIGVGRINRSIGDDPYFSAFLPPESKANSLPDARSDQYMMARCFQAMISGKLPRATPRDDPALAGGFGAVVARATAVDPASRYETFGAFVTALRNVLRAGSSVVLESETNVPEHLRSNPPSPTPSPAADVMGKTMMDAPAPKPLTPPPAPSPTADVMGKTMMDAPAPKLPTPPPAPSPVADVMGKTMMDAPAPKPPPAPPKPAVDPSVYDRTIQDLDAETVRREVERMVAEKAAKERELAEAAKREADRLAEEKAAREHQLVEAAKREAERLAAEKATRERIEAERREAERLAAMTPVKPANPTPLDAEIIETEFDDQNAARGPRRPDEDEGGLPPDRRKSAGNAVRRSESIRENETPPPQPFAPYQSPASPPAQAPAAYAAPYQPATPDLLSATMPEMPAIRPQDIPGYQKPATPTLPAKNRGGAVNPLEATKPEMPIMRPGEVPPPPESPSPSVAYNFNSSAGDARARDSKFKTNSFDPAELRARESGGELTNMMRSIPPPSGQMQAMPAGDRPKRRISPLVVIIVGLVISVALSLGAFVLLRVLNVI
jgi:serine/threonine protein kinase